MYNPNRLYIRVTCDVKHCENEAYVLDTEKLWQQLERQGWQVKRTKYARRYLHKHRCPIHTDEYRQNAIQNGVTAEEQAIALRRADPNDDGALPF